MESLWKIKEHRMEQLKQKITTNRCLRDPKLHNCALSQIVYVSKYTREALCCIPSLGFELEDLFFTNHGFSCFFHVLPSKTMVFLGNDWIFPLNILVCLRHGYCGTNARECFWAISRVSTGAVAASPRPRVAWEPLFVSVWGGIYVFSALKCIICFFCKNNVQKRLW